MVGDAGVGSTTSNEYFINRIYAHKLFCRLLSEGSAGASGSARVYTPYAFHAAFSLLAYPMSPLYRLAACCTFAVVLQPAHADDVRSNRGNDPFFQISSAIPPCAQPLGPLETEREWLDEAHYRIERGNSCWIAGRCRLPSSYLYDAEIEQSVRRRLASIAGPTQWREHTTLWLTLQRRFIYVQGCVAAEFDKQKFLSALQQTADVEQVIDQTMVGSDGVPPYSLAAPRTGPQDAVGASPRP